MIKRKICVVTGTRAEYGLLYWLMKKIESDKELQLQLIVTGMHLSPEFGLTYQEIEKDFKIDKKIEMLLSSDTSVGISKSMGLAQISFSESYENLQPNLIVVLGDRYEIFSAVSAAMIARIPIAHLHGGEATEGSIDESIRHSITKMSHLHFVATKEYKNRVIQLGEQPDRVFNVGGLGIDNINKLKLLSRKSYEQAINFSLGEKNILVTFHPVTLESSTAGIQFKELLGALDDLQDTNIIFTKANSDTDGRIINRMIDDYVTNHDNTISFTSMGQLNYLSALQFVDAVVGNSSSGLLEAPSFKIATINVGDRQSGRIQAESVINCDPNSESIALSIKKIYTTSFQKKLLNTVNPYEQKNSSGKILQIIENINITNIIKKKFHDIQT